MGQPTVTLIQFLTDDSVVAVGAPACVFLVAYAGTIWWRATRRQVRVRTWVYATATVGALALHLGWMVYAALVAGAESLVAAAVVASDGPAQRAAMMAGDLTYGDPANLDYLNGLAYLQGAVLWPVGWGLVAVVVLLAGRRALSASAGTVLAALVVGCAATIVPLALLNVADVLVLIPDLLRVVGLLAWFAVAVTFVVAAGASARKWR